ncbi:MAG TPA: acyltransferase family protein [Allosphingosinicella sp.]|nr:acyltransferase family protein [Allosphingosinicella sp.]
MSAAMSSPAPGASERLHSLDALRAIALLLGVVLHSAMSFIESPVFPIWIVADNDPSPVMAVVFFFTHLFRMAAFFLIAGYFAHLLLERRGTWGFVKNRAVRIAMPLSIFWTPVLMGILACLLWAVWIRNGHSFPPGPPPPPITVETFPWTHLWFLWVLLLFYAGLLLGRAAIGALDRKGRLAAGADKAMRLLVTPWALPVVAAPLAAALYLKADWIMWFGVPTPDTGLVPNLAATVAYGTAFLLGYLMRRQSEILLATVSRHWALFAILALGLGVGSLILAGGASIPNFLVPPERSVVNAAVYALAVFASAFAALALSLRFLSGHRPALRYLADASYWVYLIHLPVVMALQVMVHDLAWPWPAKVVAIVAGTAVVTLGTYELLIRHSFMGRWLNGRKVPRRRRPKPESLPAAA